MSMQPLPLSHQCQLATTPRLVKEYNDTCQCENKSCLATCKLWHEMTQTERDEAAIVYRAVILPSYVPYTPASKEDYDKMLVICARHRKELGRE